MSERKKAKLCGAGSVLLRIASLLSAGTAACYLIGWGVLQWVLWRVEHPASGMASSVGIIGGADGPTAIFVASKGTLGIGIPLLLVAAAAFWWGAGYLRKKQR